MAPTRRSYGSATRPSVPDAGPQTPTAAASTHTVASEPEPTESDYGSAPVDPATIVWSGLNAEQAISDVLGPKPDRRTGDLEADCIAAIAELRRYQEARPTWRMLVLHTLYSIYRQHDNDVWLQVGHAVGYAKTTVFSWAHPWRGKK